MSKRTQQEIAAPIELKNNTQENSVNARNEKEKTAVLTSKRIAYIATLTAITLLLKVLGNFLTITPTFRISFTYFGWILSAVILGPFGGAVVGFSSDVLGFLIAPVGQTINPFLILGNTLFPFIVGICYKYLPFKNKNISVLIGGILSVLICTMGINSYGLYTMYGYDKQYSFWSYLLLFRNMQPLIVAFNIVLALLFLPVIKRLKLFDL